MISIGNFEKHIEKNVLRKGSEYFRIGAVIDIDELHAGNWQATVSGTKQYFVEIKMNERNDILDYSCDCPFNGSICKHIVAVFFSIRDMGKIETNTKRKDKKIFFPGLVKKVSQQELLVFIEAYAGNHKNFKTEFELFFASADKNIDVKKNYEKLIKAVIAKNSHRGFIEYRAAINLSREIDKLIKTGFDLVNKNNLTDAFALSQAALQAMIQVITECDDSSGSIGGTIEYSMQLIEAIVCAKQAAPELKEDIFYFLNFELGKKIYFDYGDFGYTLFTFFQDLALKLNKGEEFLLFVDRAIAASTGEYDRYRRDFFNIQKINFLKLTGKTREAEQLISQKMDITEVRREEVNKAIEKKDFILAKQLIEAGIKIAEKKNMPERSLNGKKICCV